VHVMAGNCDFSAARVPLLLLVMLVLAATGSRASDADNGEIMERTIPLPEPREDSGCSIEQALAHRRSTREFLDEPLALGEAGQLLWAAQGITHGDGLRTAPSAGALFPLELYLLAGGVEGLQPGIYHYDPASHELRLRRRGDFRSRLADAALGQGWVADSAAVLVFTAVERRTARKYGPGAARYIAIEAGHAAQNVGLEAAALGLGVGFVGAFDESEVTQLLAIEDDRQPLYLLPLGRPQTPVRCGESARE